MKSNLRFPRSSRTAKQIAGWLVAAACSCAFGSHAFAAAGDLYVSDLATNSILIYKPNGTRSVLASGFNKPQGLAFDQEKNLYVADKGSGNIYKVKLNGTKTVFLSGLQSPVGVAFSGGEVLVAEEGASRVISITQSAQVRVFQLVTNPMGVAAPASGQGIRYVTNGASVLEINASGSSNDIAPGEDSINVAEGPDSDVFVTTGHGTVLEIAQDGTISTVLTGLNEPAGMAFRPARFSGDTVGVGNLYVADPVIGVITELPKVGGPATFASGGSPNFLAFEVNSSAAAPTPTPTATPRPTPRPSPSVSPTATPRPTATPEPTPGNGPARLLNISTRAEVLTNDKVLIGGFIVTGTGGPKKVLLRAIGPSLADANQPVANALANPVLELHKPDGSVITNNNWKDSQEQAITATHLAPTNDLESAIVATLDPLDPAVSGSGVYTAIVSGKNGETGTALVEIYDLDDSSSQTKLGNLSTRGFVGTDDNVLIGGFILGGEALDESILIRAIGPSLPLGEVAHALADPTLELHNADGATVSFNNDWKDSNESAIAATGLAPKKGKESAILANLLTGTYTAIVRGNEDTEGVALVEIYHLQAGQ